MEITTTIIIPNYNGLKFMDECIRSLNAQTYPNFRTLVVDNGSTDGSVEWLKEHQIDTIFLPENTGFSGRFPCPAWLRNPETRLPVEKSVENPKLRKNPYFCFRKELNRTEYLRFAQ
jgi:cellulose synthase/poly-beta-1,6-N-acetylglucosamine synthase-like glycosyltransferase